MSNFRVVGGKDSGANPPPPPPSKPKKPRRKGGRPRRDFSVEQFETLCWAQCSQGEIAAFFGAGTSTINRLCRREPYKSIFEAGREGGKSLLRSQQFQKAAEGNVAMLIWLGKQALGQKDQTVHDVMFSGEIVQKRILQLEAKLSVINGNPPTVPALPAPTGQ